MIFNSLNRPQKQMKNLCQKEKHKLRGNILILGLFRSPGAENCGCMRRDAAPSYATAAASRFWVLNVRSFSLLAAALVRRMSYDIIIFLIIILNLRRRRRAA